MKFRIIEPAQLISIITGVAYGTQKTAKDGRVVSERTDNLRKKVNHMVKVYIDGDDELEIDYSYNK